MEPGAATKTKEMGRHVEAVLRALDILDSFQFQPPLNLKRIHEITGITRSRIIRLAGTLESRGYLLYDPKEKQFRLGPRLHTLGKIFEANNTLIALARPILKELVRETGELASLYVMDGLERVALAREKGTHEISYSVIEGQRMELYAGASGKVLLAYAPPEIQTKVVNKKFLRKLTPGTISNPADLARELEELRCRGHASSKGERVSDVWSVAAPVFDHSGSACSSVGITGPLYRIPRRTQSLYVKIIKDKAAKLSHLLSWQGTLYRREEEK